MDKPVIITLPTDRDAELWVLEDVLVRLNALKPDERKRILKYLVERFEVHW